MAVLGFCCYVGIFSSCSEWGYSLVVVCRVLIAVTSLVAEHRFQACGLQQLACGFSRCGSWALEHRLSSCDAEAQLLHGMGVFPYQGSNLCLLHSQEDCLLLSHQASLHLFIFLFPLCEKTDANTCCYNLCERVDCLCFLLGFLWFLVLYLGLE